jgi:hypothetical protein
VRAASAPAPIARHRRRRPVLLAAATVALLAAFGLGALVARDRSTAPPLEFAAELRSADGSVGASIEGTKVGEGRIVRLVSDDLPILPTGELYEVWFLAPGDSPSSPDRISAGTFHPDADGRTDIELTAAVDPTLNPIVVVTAEAGDGDPAPGIEVLRAEVALR